MGTKKKKINGTVCISPDTDRRTTQFLLFSKPGWLTTPEIYSLGILVARTLKSLCWLDHVPSKDLKEDPPASPVSGSPKCPLAYKRITPFSSSLFIKWLSCMSLLSPGTLFSYKDTSPNRLKVCLTPVWLHLNQLHQPRPSLLIRLHSASSRV